MLRILDSNTTAVATAAKLKLQIFWAKSHIKPDCLVLNLSDVEAIPDNVTRPALRFAHCVVVVANQDEKYLHYSTALSIF